MGQRYKVCFEIDVESIDGEKNVLNSVEACELFIKNHIMNNFRKSLLKSMRTKLVPKKPFTSLENHDYYLDTLAVMISRQAVNNLKVYKATGPINPDKIDVMYN